MKFKNGVVMCLMALLGMTASAANAGANFQCNGPAEGFESGISAAAWSVQTNEPAGPQWTSIALSGEIGNFTNGTGEAASVSSDIFGGAEMDTSLVTPAFTLAGFGSASVSYSANFQNLSGRDFLDLDISTDSGANWTTLLSWNADHGTFRSAPGEDVTVDLTAYAGQSGLLLRWRYYDPNTGDWNWYAQVDNVALTCGAAPSFPNIGVSPTSLTSTQAVNTTSSQTLTVANTGTADLNWSIDEEPVPRPQVPAPSIISPNKLSAPGAVQRSTKEWQDLINSPSAEVVQDGSFEAGTPSPFWTEASTTFGTPLCDTGSCGTGTGTGPRTGDWWAWFGGIASAEAGSVSQSVTITAGGAATLSFWVEQTVCSGDAADFLEVTIDGTQLWTTTAADPACGTVGYRQVTLDVSAYADGGAHTLVFNSQIFGSATSNFFVDDVSLDAVGGPTACSTPSSVPWLSVSPANGITAGGASSSVTVSFDSTGLTVGNTYSANLCVRSDDPDTGPGNGTALVVVPVTLTVTAPVTHTVTSSVGTPAGTITPLGAQTVTAGNTISFTLTPNVGYHIDSVGGTCGGTLAGTTYTTNAITGDCTVIANFAVDMIPVATSVPGGHGSITGPVTIPYGGTGTFTLTPDPGYAISSVTGCGGTLSGNVYTTGPITGACTITVSFALRGGPAPTLVPANDWRMLALMLGLMLGGAFVALRRR